MPVTIKSLNLTNQQRLIILDTKNFAMGDRMLYANKTKDFRIAQYRPPDRWFVDVNIFLEQTFNSSDFVHVMKMVCTGYNNTCPLFTREGKLISYDSSHLTKPDALYIGKIIFHQKPLNKL